MAYRNKSSSYKPYFFSLTIMKICQIDYLEYVSFGFSFKHYSNYLLSEKLSLVCCQSGHSSGRWRENNIEVFCMATIVRPPCQCGQTIVDTRNTCVCLLHLHSEEQPDISQTRHSFCECILGSWCHLKLCMLNIKKIFIDYNYMVCKKKNDLQCMCFGHTVDWMDQPPGCIQALGGNMAEGHLYKFLY